MLHPRCGRIVAVFLCAAMLVTTGCNSPFAAGGGASGNLPQLSDRSFFTNPATVDPDSRHIKHIVVIVQENRTVDNLFNGFPGADTVQNGRNTHGRTIRLVSTSLTAPYDLSHRHGAWVLDYDNGAMDGFNTEDEHCFKRAHGGCPRREVASYGFVPRSEIEPYWDLGEQYTFADHFFQTNQGPSFSAHQYIVSGTSTISEGSDLKAAENPNNPQKRRRQGGCDSVPGTTVSTIDPNGNEGHPVFPCFVRNSIFHLMNRKKVSWHYYQEFHGPGLWHAVDALKPIRYSRSYSKVIWPSERVIEDIRAGHLADVTFITPSAQESDHAGKNDGTGPSWVASIVNTIGASSYWKDTAIFVTWDDWGGWYDHARPTVYNSFEDGFRVPLIVISPYAKKGHVSHTPYEFGSILKFIEKTFDLGSLGSTDVRSHDLKDCFDFGRKPRAFTHIHTKYSVDFFVHRPVDYDSPDDDQ